VSSWSMRLSQSATRFTASRSLLTRCRCLYQWCEDVHPGGGGGSESSYDGTAVKCTSVAGLPNVIWNEESSWPAL